MLMKKVLFLSLFIFMSYSMDLDATLKQIKSTEFGKSFLEKMQIQDPIDKIIRDMSNIYNGIDYKLEQSAKYTIDFQTECGSILKTMKQNLKDQHKRLKDTENNIARKKPRYDLISNRLNQKKKQQQQLELDSTRYIELRQAENQFYQYNTDQLEKAMHAVTSIRNKFVQYLSQRQNRQRKAAKPTNFLENDDDDYDEEEEERLHYEKYVFVQIQVTIQKVTKGLEIGGITELLNGFQDVCLQLHDMKTENTMYDDTEATLNRISQQVIDVCTSLMDWIGQVKNREDKAEDAKHDIAVQTMKLVKKQLSDTIQEISELTNEASSLAHSLEQMEQSRQNLEFSLGSNDDLMKTKQEQCDDQKVGFSMEKKELQKQYTKIEKNNQEQQELYQIYWNKKEDNLKKQCLNSDYQHYKSQNIMLFRLGYRFTQKKVIVPHISGEQFMDQYTLLLFQISQAFTKLKEYEDRITIYEGITDLVIKVKDHGEYNFTPNKKERLLYFQSPFELQQYFYNQTQNQWCSIKDEHLLLELLTRETGKYLKAYLDL